MSSQVSELCAVLTFADRPALMPEAWVRAWSEWGYTCRIESRGPDGAEVFKGGAFTIVRVANGAPDLPWDDLEQQVELLRGVPDTFDHAAALAAARESEAHAELTVRVLEPGPWIVLTELLIALRGLVEAMGATAVWLPHCEALIVAADFLAEAEALRVDEDGSGAAHPYSLYVSVQLRLPLERGHSAVGFTRGLARFGWPDFEIEDFVRSPRPALIHKTLVNAGIHQLIQKGAIGPEEFILSSSGRLGTGMLRRSANFDGDVLPLDFLS